VQPSAVQAVVQAPASSTSRQANSSGAVQPVHTQHPACAYAAAAGSHSCAASANAMSAPRRRADGREHRSRAPCRACQLRTFCAFPGASTGTTSGTFYPAPPRLQPGCLAQVCRPPAGARPYMVGHVMAPHLGDQPCDSPARCWPVRPHERILTARIPVESQSVSVGCASASRPDRGGCAWPRWSESSPSSRGWRSKSPRPWRSASGPTASRRCSRNSACRAAPS